MTNEKVCCIYCGRDTTSKVGVCCVCTGKHNPQRSSDDRTDAMLLELWANRPPPVMRWNEDDIEHMF